MRTCASTVLALVIGSGIATQTYACPIASDMKSGVLFRTSEGGVELHIATGPAWIQVQTTYADGAQAVLEYDRGLYLASSTPVENGKVKLSQREVFGSAFNLKKWADPAPNIRWQNASEEGGTARSSDTKTLRIGKCTLQGFDVTIEFAGENYTEDYFYASDLGTALLVASDDGQNRETYRYTATQAAK